MLMMQAQEKKKRKIPGIKGTTALVTKLYLICFQIVKKRAGLSNLFRVLIYDNGRVNQNVLPLPNSLYAPIRPLCFLMISAEI